LLSTGGGLSFSRVVVLIAGLTSVASAQTSTNEVWPELDVFWQPAEHQRTFLELSASTEREGSKREGTVGLYQDYLKLPAMFFRGGYRYTFSTRDASYRESRIVAEANVAAYSSRPMRLVNRTRLELRHVNGDNSYRIRDRLHLQRVSTDQSGMALAPYVTFEAYYDSRYASIARIGGRIGTEARVYGPASMDVYIARQNNSRSEPRHVNALGVTAKLNY
jgi:hypothetical protein